MKSPDVESTTSNAITVTVDIENPKSNNSTSTSTSNSNLLKPRSNTNKKKKSVQYDDKVIKHQASTTSILSAKENVKKSLKLLPKSHFYCITTLLPSPVSRSTTTTNIINTNTRKTITATTNPDYSTSTYQRTHILKSWTLHRVHVIHSFLKCCLFIVNV